VARQHPAHGNLPGSDVILLEFVLSGEVMKEIASSSKTKSKIKLKEKHAFDAQAFLDSARGNPILATVVKVLWISGFLGR
jgi:hypothetical protein